MIKMNKDKWKEVFYGDYVDHIEETERNPEIRKNSKYVSVDNIESNEVRRIMHCRHYFHRTCIDTWFQTNVHCPTCRYDIRTPNT